MSFFPYNCSKHFLHIIIIHSNLIPPCYCHKLTEAMPVVLCLRWFTSKQQPKLGLTQELSFSLELATHRQCHCILRLQDGQRPKYQLSLVIALLKLHTPRDRKTMVKINYLSTQGASVSVSIAITYKYTV